MTSETILADEFCAICDCGGRLSGTGSEQKAVTLLRNLGQAATGVEATEEQVPYEGWRALDASLSVSGLSHPVQPLVRSVATPDGGLEAEVLDLGRGTPEEFSAHRDEIPGRIVLVRHELMFSPGTIHRRFKYLAAVEAGAAGFLIAGPAKGGLVAGSSGRGAGTGIPAAGISPETADALKRRADGYPMARLSITTEEGPAQASNLFFDLPGETAETVVLSAHIDGHDLGESAIDNASGLAVALEVCRRIGKSAAASRRGLRLAFFNVEEWALTGSAHHIAQMTAEERNRIALNVNLDSVAGSPNLTALTSGFAGLEPFLLRQSAEADVPLGLFRPLQTNSDHANFAQAGIPAFRLVAGFAEHFADTRLVLTPRDRRDLVPIAELERAADLATRITFAAMQADPDEVRSWRR